MRDVFNAHEDILRALYEFYASMTLLLEDEMPGQRQRLEMTVEDLVFLLEHRGLVGQALEEEDVVKLAANVWHWAPDLVDGYFWALSFRAPRPSEHV